MILLQSQPQSVWSSIIPVVTLVVGWALASLTEYWKGKRERTAKALERKEARIIRQNEFQRTTLLALQDAFTQLSESTGMGYGYRSTATDNQRPRLVPHSVLETYRGAQTQVSTLKARVQDDSIRMQVMKAQSKFY